MSVAFGDTMTKHSQWSKLLGADSDVANDSGTKEAWSPALWR